RVRRAPLKDFPPSSREAGPALDPASNSFKERNRYFGAGTSAACAAPFASSTDATSQPRAGVFLAWSWSIERVNDAEPPGASVAKSPLDTGGANGLMDAEPVVSTKVPGTSENAFTL